MATKAFFVGYSSHDRLDQVLCRRMDRVSLGEAGRREALRLASRPKTEAISAIYVSRLQRATETAEPLAQALKLKAVRSEALNEIDMGEWTGTTFAALDRRPDWGRRQAGDLERAPGGESLQDVQMRSVRWMKRHAVATFRHGDHRRLSR